MGIQVTGSSASSLASSLASQSVLNPSAGATGLSSDSKALQGLRGTAARDPKAAVKEVAKQFESLFMQELMKSMRKATQSSGLLDNAGTQMGTDMLDDQFALKMSGLPGGLGAVIERQLQRQMGGVAPDDKGGVKVRAEPVAAVPASPATPANALSVRERQLDFVQRNTASARAAEAQTGIPASFMVAQAAHESGWGQRDIRNADGSSSNNLFGIKAGAQWKGPVAEVTTTEYVDGKATKVTAKFRSYESADASFRDYAKLMKESPRYAGVLASLAPEPAHGIQLVAYHPTQTLSGVDSGANSSTNSSTSSSTSSITSSSAANASRFAHGLQRAGYATDPAYADKLTRVINTTLRLQRVVT